MLPESLDCHRHMIEIKNLSFSYGEQKVISDLNFTVRERDFVGIIGSNGAGKSTLLKMIVGLLTPSEGDIKLFGESVRKFKDWERIGYVPQKNAFNPLFPATVREVVMSGLYNNKNIFRRLSRQQQRKCDDALEVMRIQNIQDKRVGMLSGGQQQRVFLARALINHPDLLILDEPTVGIDAETQAAFFELITHMHAHHHMTFLMVSHDIDMICSYLGQEPIQRNGKINFYSRHSHELQNCAAEDLQHSLT
ncbi:metal ABC transporter ATP-binding protein [Paenibacillus sp. HN-1]|uniref:metal ABC transporter ATP-binding protein n=1 Tax=Paenibacillus TaxID=44249 RepID=UPI001CA8B9CC|nr:MULTISPECIES: metal ABC transporter ATP-binding protein [Paenibacillus]MBY9081459.1 metal ABC transporter ATP-binding protein [Paenibacillus sp. CGMCC 1.18879]MBY9084979.1 metal ABC transporter ATP-binding protein [Paenibacillus sinensis]